MTRWSDLNRELLDHAALENWGLYRDVRLEMADYLRKNQKTLGALTTYLEVSYLDANGPSNLQGSEDPKILKNAPRFDPSAAIQAPRVIGEIYVNSQKLRMSSKDLKARYVKVASTLQKYLKTPADPVAGWIELENELENYKKGFD